MTTYDGIGGLRVERRLRDFVRDEALPGSGLTEHELWAGVAGLVAELGPRIRDAVATRVRIQQQLDDHHRASPGPVDPAAYEELLRSIGYLVDRPAPFRISTEGVAPEIARGCGPQLVVPALNARFAINAANARWGSLYDALYGTDAIAETEGRERGETYNPIRGAAVIATAKGLLDEICPLARGSHAAATAYVVSDGRLQVDTAAGPVGLAHPAQLVGFGGEREAPTAVLLVHHGLHLEIRVDRDHPVGRTDPAGVADVQLEAALTTIVDLEDSVAAVDGADKAAAYRNWLGLTRRTLTAEVAKGGSSFTRRMAPDRSYRTPEGGDLVLPGTSVLLVRHVGHLMTTDAVLDPEGREISEGLLDAVVTALCARPADGEREAPSIYAVKPKLHGPDEVALACDVFAGVEELLGLPPRTVKIGIMDEERRTSLNLEACVAAARDRVVFVNTGFLDRTGDEIRSATFAGPMARKGAMRSTAWIAAYEEQNVAVALACGFVGRAQIGKGMWAAPDDMAAMLATKIGQLEAGATTAWVPSPTAATLHALHYHRVDVTARQAQLAARPQRSWLRDLLTLPLGEPAGWTAEDRRHELDGNVQSTLGYVVRWVDDGVGCSKVPDIDGTPLMEDRATCRISSQLVTNWLLHGIVSRDDVEDSLRRMAVFVDEQNAADPGYRPMAPAYDGEAFLAARQLLLDGLEQPNGYTEPVLHPRRRAVKELPG